MLSDKNYMTTYIQDQQNVQKFWIGLHKNAIVLKENVDSLYKLQQDLTESESENSCSIFKHCQSLMRITENHKKKISLLRTNTPSFEFMCKDRQRLINAMSCMLKQITDIESNFVKFYGSCYQFTKLEKNIMYIMNSQKVILQSRLRKEQNLCVA